MPVDRVVTIGRADKILGSIPVDIARGQGAHIPQGGADAAGFGELTALVEQGVFPAANAAVGIERRRGCPYPHPDRYRWKKTERGA